MSNKSSEQILAVMSTYLNKKKYPFQSNDLKQWAESIFDKTKGFISTKTIHDWCENFMVYYGEGKGDAPELTPWYK